MAGKPYKKEKLEEKLVTDINTILRRDVSDSRLTFVSVTKVELSVDYQQAVVYWDTFDSSTRGDAKKAIETVAGKLRSTLAKSLKMRTVPSLSFKYDSQFEDEESISKILNEEKDKGKGF